MISFLQVAAGEWSYADGGAIGGLVAGIIVLWRRYQDALESRHTDALVAQKGLNDAAAVLKDMAKSIEHLGQELTRVHDEVSRLK